MDGSVCIFFFVALSLLLLHVAVSQNDLFLFSLFLLLHFVVLFLGLFRGTAVWDSKLRKPFKLCPVTENIPTHTRLRARFPSDNLEKLPSCTALTKTTTKNNAQETLVSFFSLLVATLYSNKQADLMVVRILPAAVRVETTCLQLCDY